MNDRDKEVFEKWLNDQDYKYDTWDGQDYRDGKIVSIYSETELAWQAACEYKQRDIESLEKEQVTHIEILQDEMGQIIKDREWEVNYLSKRTKSLESENKKLRVALELIEKMRGGANQCNVAAREALKDVGKE